MKTIERNGLHILLADEGMTLCKNGETFFSTEIYLGNGDSNSNYDEVTLEEVERILEEQEGGEG